MNAQVYDRIKVLIEETNDAFYSSGAINADYAEFATLALSEFKHALSNPRLTRHQLVKMLRAGMTRHREGDPESCWASFMAAHMASGSNRNGSYAKFSWDELHEEKA